LKYFLLIILLIYLVQVKAQQNKLPGNHYSIRATLNDRTRSIDGHASIDFRNNSADTLHFIWFHLWPNAFRNDRTALNDYLLDKGTTAFYFAPENKRGYINRLAFRSGGTTLRTEDHAVHQDLVKVILAAPLAPGNSINISTPFHVKVPYRFDNIGYAGGSYRLKFWYPAPAAISEIISNAPTPLTDAATTIADKASFAVQLTLPATFTVRSNASIKDTLYADSTKTISLAAVEINDIELEIEKISRAKPEKTAAPFRGFRPKMEKLFSWPVLPAVGYNYYDGLQAGVLLQNIYDSSKPLQFIASPLFAFNSRRITGAGELRYTMGDRNAAHNWSIGMSASAFSTNEGTDSEGKKIFEDVLKIVPYLRLQLPAGSSSAERFIEYRFYHITEGGFNYALSPIDSLYYPAKAKKNSRYINQLSFQHSNNRVLYPYRWQLQIQQGQQFYRLNATGNYFFNYARGGGLRVRAFAARFGYIGAHTISKEFATARYQPKLTAVRGEEDFTYSNYFLARNNYQSMSGQIMMRDGGLKLKTDLFQDLQGRSDNWLASVNLSTSLPKLTPVALPLRVFADVGTYAEAWDRENPNARFLYVAGLQLSLFGELLHIYAPLMYSKQFRERLASVPEENTFLKRISFSLDIQKLDFTRPFLHKIF